MQKMQMTDIVDQMLKGLMLAVLVVLAAPYDALAQLSQTVNEVRDGISNIAPLVSAGAYIIGAVTIVDGMFKLREHTEDPGRNKLAPALSRIGIGGGVAALPATAQWVNQSIAIQGGGLTYQGFQPVN